MFDVLRSSWALLLGMLLLMVGNGLQGTLLGVRGDIEGFSTVELSVIMSAYFAGFLGGSRLAPEMIRRVGHIRVFAALGSLVSAALILFPVLTDPISWTVLRLIIGFCFSGVYVTAESWLNNSTTNENRGKTLSVYMVVQLAGVVSAQALLVAGDPSGYNLFIILSVLVSLAFAPILLSVTPTPAFEATRPMGFREIIQVSPLGCMGIFVLGGVFSAMFGMSAVYATEVGFSLGQISIFVASFYVGGLLLQYPIGWISDRMDRRRLILIVSALGAVAGVLAILSGSNFYLILIAAFVVGGMANPLYALLVAYTNDFLEHDQMAAAGGRMIFINGVGAIFGPLIVGALMNVAGPQGYFLYIVALMAGLAVYAAYRMTVRPAPLAVDTGSYAPVMPTASPVAMELAQEAFIEAALEDEEAADKPVSAV
ncbi:MFS transporter [Roseobacter sp. HKCCD9010]|uniref:MFS transporter n=1 Tax=unclassified Roseobacter TaxID=196798 RepID=UPI00149091E7|nr:MULTISPECIES: MFS transporter [unclassified Roseobacter]MBF9050699.1 MFS transporter [Rhodobacterales bacterium HKCCD4356]NNV11883.1 MFS transporter [Roseobacter sp. HKCCD7357]NNV18034.1 MFS transporter [Roseobacter sp. HKCCD8768]NNV26125.1 MFS transporter [Roseobacter sp. HKCCD8192]NNV31761.1 MFS transporter [Roseobacter sp. HKCCD9061]